MRVLALDATTRQGSVALVVDDAVIEERPGDASRSHAERLPSELLALLSDHDVTLRDVDVFAVASGPGSFTGLRIGIATIQGLAFVTDRPIVAVSTLEAAAHIASLDSADGALVGAWIDAQRGQVFSALYRVTAAGRFAPERLAVVEPPTADDPAATLDRWRAFAPPAGIAIAGDGTVRYAAALRDAGVVEVRAPATLAGAIARLAVARAKRGETVTPAGVRPEYVRRPDAEIERDRRAATPSRS